MKIKDITETQVGTISGSTRGPDGQPLYTMKDSNGVETKVPGKDIHTDPSGKGVTVAATGVPSGTPVNSSQPTLENGEGEENSEQVIKLANAGHEPEEIAQHLGMDINDVYTIVSNFSGGDNIHPETDPDLIGSGQNVDVGGDATDSFLDQIKLQPEDDIGHGISEMSRIRHLAGLKEADAPVAAPTPAPAPTTTAIVPAADVDPAETALKSAQVDPELMQQVEANTVRDAEGDVDLSATFQKIADQIPAEPQIRAEWAEAFKQFDEKFSHIEQDPEFMKMTPEEQVETKQDVQEVRALFQKFMEFAVQMSNTVKSGAQQVRTAMAAPGAQNPLKGVKTLTPPVQETADDQLLKQMLSIAGLR